MVKPTPLGLSPRRSYDEQRLMMDFERLRIIDEAIVRYMDAGLKIPVEWLEERNDIVRRISNDIVRRSSDER